MQKANDRCVCLRIVDTIDEKEGKMRFFGLKSCDTCRKALKALAAAGVAPEVIDVRQDGIADADVQAIVATFGEAAINRSSTTWRGLAEAERSLPTAELILAHPTLLKRPAIVRDGVWTIGWKPDVQKLYLGEAA